ncbi:hypothetical protein [Alteromonas sp. CYL-A6]|uniref:hypothetical protein n=1 Tax=Alteromonas nitratireducens TaxID=3390813 RepID=UPI0034C4E0CE
MRFIIHLGLGKTGTTSVQRHFRENFSRYQDEGVLYAGLRFETLGKDKQWQRGAGTYRKLSPDELLGEFKQATQKYVSYASDRQLHTVVLSNESFSTELPRLKPYFDWLMQHHDVHFAVYVRDIDSWVASAYEQWGIKDVAKKGNVPTFRQYLATAPYRQPGNVLQTIRQYGYLPRTYIKNMRAAKNNDVTEDFCAYFSLPLIVKPIRDNEAPDDNKKALFFLMQRYYHKRFKVRKVDKLYDALTHKGEEQHQFITQFYPRIQDANIDSIAKEKRRVNRYLPADEQFSEDVAFKKADPQLAPLSYNLLSAYVQWMNITEQADPNVLIQAASRLETVDLTLSYNLLAQAKIFRPNGKVVNARMEEYAALLARGVKAKRSDGIVKTLIKRLKRS